MRKQALLVEDSPTQAQGYKAVLENLGLEVNLVEDGQRALQFAFEHHPDLIILDVNLPVMDGMAVCARLSRDSATRDIPVIMLTSRDRAVDASAGLRVGAVDYIAKDEFAVEILEASLERLGMV